MADDRREEEQEPRIVVRDRRRVTTEGEVREIPSEHPGADAEAAPVEPGAPTAGPAPADDEPRVGPRLLDDDDDLDNDDLDDDDDDEMPTLRDVSGAADEPGSEPGQAPPIRNVYEYLTQVTAEMSIWALASLGLMPNPLTGLIAADKAQADFAIDAAEGLLDLLGDKLPAVQRQALTQGFVLQFVSVAAQLLQQPPQVRLQQIAAVRFGIDTAERFLKRLTADGAEISPETAELAQAVRGLKLRFMESTGGGGIIG